MLIVNYMIVNHARPLKSARMISTLVGRSSQVYKPVRIIYKHPNKDPEFNIHLASGLLPDRCLSIHKSSKSIRQIRHHVDEDKENRVLVYNYATTNVLEMTNDCPPLPLQARKMILKEVGLALKDMHARNWIHLGNVKPDNVFIDWFVDMESKFCLEKMQLGDLDCALQLIGTHLLNHKIGNVMWQSPEGQLGRGMGSIRRCSLSDFWQVKFNPYRVPVSSNMCLFVLTGVAFFHPDFESLPVESERVILHKSLSNFGPLPDVLVKHVDDEKAGELLKDLWKMIEQDEERAEGAEMVDIMTDPYCDGVGSKGIFGTEERFVDDVN
ncbi:uncharacterized protein Bfra_005160 [Botrytis fragariae]|uniref:Protein kinase domain-containing protein n=1 Tax=Botrytis fragariae TaxID=1964551 RepID=A0A8H6AU89_9HELO|nr:uncharacterized protein Bfra_005160 [Botrytis fragariae]KAF5873696.1 hypothetical protein Bfra_005160 [Botrytis fragariae]